SLSARSFFSADFEGRTWSGIRSTLIGPSLFFVSFFALFGGDPPLILVWIIFWGDFRKASRSAICESFLAVACS
ncbi:hypothetical protein PMAYCL1PPCAC_02805, partial [Pristionchus mayeri]